MGRFNETWVRKKFDVKEELGVKSWTDFNRQSRHGGHEQQLPRRQHDGLRHGFSLCLQ